MKEEGRNGMDRAAATVRTASAATTGRKRRWTHSMLLACHALSLRTQEKSAWLSLALSIKAESAGVAVKATPKDARTARMKASAKGPTKWPCTLLENNSGRNTAITTKVA